MNSAVQHKSSGRLEGLDLARFFAFAGMVIVNFHIVMSNGQVSGWAGSLTKALEGRAAATFVVLAGIGLAMTAVRTEAAVMLTATLKRAVFLLVIGLLNMLVFDADIIHYYAFYFLFGSLLLYWSSRRLVAMIIAVNLVFVALVLILDYETGWNWDTYTYSGFWTVDGFIRNLFFNGWHPVIPWIAFLLFGIVLGRLALGERKSQLWLFLGGLSVYVSNMAISSFLTSWAKGVDPELVWFFGTGVIPPMPLYIVAGCAAASATIGFFLLSFNVFKRTGLAQWLLPAGRQTLTLYFAHIYVGMGLLGGMGMMGNQTSQSALATSLAFIVFAAAFSHQWSLRFKRGMLEALMRRTAG